MDERARMNEGCRKSGCLFCMIAAILAGIFAVTLYKAG